MSSETVPIVFVAHTHNAADEDIAMAILSIILSIILPRSLFSASRIERKRLSNILMFRKEEHRAKIILFLKMNE